MKTDEQDNVSPLHYRGKGSTLHRAKTQEERQLLHPLELNDKLAFDKIKTVRLDFLTNEAKTPIPRCQGLPPRAFSKLTGSSILISLSQGWFFQTHPDPYGQKLDLIRNVFAPQLRERYPHTDIQVFFDYLSIPQEPRTENEGDVFDDAIRRINSMYIYADVIVFLELEPPSLDMTIHSAIIDMSDYRFFDFIDVVQVFATTSKTGPQLYDSILTCGSLKLTSSQQIAKYTDKHHVTYLLRPFGRPNTIINDDRGWLFLERISIAAKAAAAEQSQFDDIVVSNSEKLRVQIYKWSERLRDAASKQNIDPRALSDLLNHFDGILKTKKFSFTSDEIIVRGLMKKLVNQFANDWKGEVEKQKSMGKRAREMLLRWGCFSEDYVDRAGFLESADKTLSWSHAILRLVCIGVLAPSLAILPFAFEVTSDPSEDEFVRTLWFGSVWAAIPVLSNSSYANEFAQIPYGKHYILLMFYMTITNMFASCTLCVFECISRVLLKLTHIPQIAFELYLEFQLFPSRVLA
jgi:hypothetical protein